MRPRELSSSVESFAARTPTLPPATHTNSYALGSRDVVLVEPATPYEDEQRAWLEWARALRSSGRNLRAVVVTHHHADHVGGAKALSSELGLPLWAHEATLARVDLGPHVASLHEGQAIVLDGPVPTRWEVLHTPGHAPGHVCLYERSEGYVVVGDMVASTGTILIAPGDGHMATYLAQLARLEALGARTALPAHGDPIDAPSQLFAFYRAHRAMREQKIVDAFASVPAARTTAEELLPVAYADTPAALFPIALLSLRAHLEKLVEEGRVSSDGASFALSATG